MPYKLKLTNDAKKIKEQEYATAESIMFTTFTSCIGVIAKKGTALTAVHLVMKADDETLFDEQAATQVLSVLPDTYEKVWIIGCTDLWANPQNAVLGGFLKLKAGIKSLEVVQIFSWRPGIYGASISGSDIEVEFG